MKKLVTMVVAMMMVVCFALPAMAEGALKIGFIGPVSYTHLDVYKRQPQWSELQDKVKVVDEKGAMEGGWWRVPFQRDYVVCYHREYEDVYKRQAPKRPGTFLEYML